MNAQKYIIGTSGFSFDDWVGTFYPAGTRPEGMFEQYCRHFAMVELNFTFYAMPGLKTFDSLLSRAPRGFEFWVKVNKQVTHEQRLDMAEEFYKATEPLRSRGALAGNLLQFPQSFKRTTANRKFLAGAIERLRQSPVAVEFRDSSWDNPATTEGLRQFGVTLVVPDAPPIAGLYHPPPTATSPTAYLRLHSRNADKWYGDMAARYDYNYSDGELRDIAAKWEPLESGVEKVYCMFNNCHRGQAAQNAEAFRRILGQIQ